MFQNEDLLGIYHVGEAMRRETKISLMALVS